MKDTDKIIHGKIFLILLILLSFEINAEIQYFPLHISVPELFDAESLFVGVSMIATGEEITIVHDTNTNRPLGMLYYLEPSKNDSLVPIFHNRINDYLDEKDTLKIINFPRGKYFTLCYIPIDTGSYYNYVRFHKLYSGQNRAGVDLYVTDIKNASFSNRFGIGGRVDKETVEYGFMTSNGGDFANMLLKIKGVYVEVFEKNKIPIPRSSRTEYHFVDKLEVQLTLPAEGLKTDLKQAEEYSIPVTSSKIDIYYTLDGSDPSETNHLIYSAPITLDKTTTIKAMAVAQNDTSCFPSDIASYTYIKDATSVKLNSFCSE